MATVMAVSELEPGLLAAIVFPRRSAAEVRPSLP
jgi:hypothetical protein